jgi:8-oxo-dGTP pyrophosphatase MutT (NUDIX family)
MVHESSKHRRTRVIRGHRVGARGAISVSCTAAIFDHAASAILLTRRSDNGQWCLPGGRIEPGETVWEACQREIREETGLETSFVRLIGIYSSPDWLIEYPSGDRIQAVSCFFDVRVTSGIPALSDETTELRYFTRDECAALDLLENHVERIHDAFIARQLPFVK